MQQHNFIGDVQARQAKRLRADLQRIDERLSGCPRRPIGLRARSVQSFLVALRDHKRGQLEDMPS